MTGLTPKAYATAHRGAKLRKGLVSSEVSPRPSTTQATVPAAASTKSLTGLLGMTPTQYRAGGLNEEIHFAVGENSLGAILVASSAKGVVAILLGNDPELLVRDLQDRFPKAKLIGADRDYESLVAQVVGLIEAPGIGFGLPLDIRGTAFQQRVWRALQNSSGKTVSYAEVARRIGTPKAVRAVAGACAANNLAVAIPCHRVVRNDGTLSGYAWGVDKKRILLDREADQAA